MKNYAHGSLKKYPPKSNLNTKTENFYLDPEQDTHSGSSSDKDGLNHHYSSGFQVNHPHQYAGDFESSFKQGQQQFSNSTLSTYDFESGHGEYNLPKNIYDHRSNGHPISIPPLQQFDPRGRSQFSVQGDGKNLYDGQMIPQMHQMNF